MKKEKENQKSHSIRFHIFSVIAVLSVILVAVLWFFHVLLLNVAYKVAKESDINRAANLLTENIDSAEISSLISQVAIEYELCVLITDTTSYNQLYNKHFLNDCILCRMTTQRSLLENWHSEALHNGGEYSVALPRDQFRDFIYDNDNYEGDAPDSDSSENCVICTRVIESENGDEYLLILNTDIKPVQTISNVFRIVLVFVTLALCLFAFFIAYILSRRLSKPIVKITSSAQALQNKDYAVRFEENGPTEVRLLAQTLNTTAKELDNADRLQKELVANISHDLRTPLTMISGYSEFMRDFPSEISPENMQVIIDETARLNSLVNDLLYVSKLQSGTQVADIKEINLTALISGTIKRYDTLLTHKEYVISFISDCEVWVEADATRLLQVVYNLVNNAINYTGDDKTVTVRQDVLDDIVRVSIIDTGEGISEENLPLVWDRYYKIDKVHKRAVLGTGLGLSIVKNVLMLHNSRFGVSSEVGNGSTFWFEFKIVRKEGKDTVKEQDSPSAESQNEAQES